MLQSKTYGGYPVSYRPGTSDEGVLREVLERRCYRRVSVGFDVKSGERWLDLGANIGAFAVYARTHDATTLSIEPDPECFDLLTQNAPWASVQRAAIVASTMDEVEFFASPREKNKAAGTIVGTRLNRVETRASIKLVSRGMVSAVCAEEFRDETFDGIKMDVEGAEGALLDDWRLPKVRKLVLEYHLSVDNSVENLRRRINVLQGLFQHVAYPPEFDRAFASGSATFKSFFDRLVFAWN